MTHIQLQSIEIYDDVQEERKRTRRLAWLTWLGVFFLPLSLLASFFSFGGDYSPSQSHFWVFWAAAVPIILITMVVFAYAEQQEIQKQIRKATASHYPSSPRRNVYP
jgi:Mg2+ and Co2+ transporter CorA